MPDAPEDDAPDGYKTFTRTDAFPARRIHGSVSLEEAAEFVYGSMQDTVRGTLVWEIERPGARSVGVPSVRAKLIAPEAVNDEFVGALFETASYRLHDVVQHGFAGETPHDE